MNCPKCGNKSSVVKTHPCEGYTITRDRKCRAEECHHNFKSKEKLTNETIVESLETVQDILRRIR